MNFTNIKMRNRVDYCRFSQQVGKTFLSFHKDLHWTLANKIKAILKKKSCLLSSKKQMIACVYSFFRGTHPGKSCRWVTRREASVNQTDTVFGPNEGSNKKGRAWAYLWRRRTCPRCSRTRRLSWAAGPSRTRWWAWGILALQSYLSPAKTSGPERHIKGHGEGRNKSKVMSQGELHWFYTCSPVYLSQRIIVSQSCHISRFTDSHGLDFRLQIDKGGFQRSGNLGGTDSQETTQCCITGNPRILTYNRG